MVTLTPVDEPMILADADAPTGRGLVQALRDYPAHVAKGVLELLKTPGDVASGEIDLNTTEGLDRAIALGTSAIRLNKLPLTGRTAGFTPTGFGDEAPAPHTASKIAPSLAEAPEANSRPRVYIPTEPETPPPAIPSAPEPPVASRAGNINLERIFAPEDVKDAIRQSADSNSGFIEARRGVISNEQTREMAGLLGMSADDLSKRKVGEAFNAEQMFAARELLVEQANKVREIARMSVGGDDLAKARFAEEVTRLRVIQEQVSGATAEAGRALQQFRMLSGATKSQIADIVAASKATGIEDLANKIAGLDDINQVGKFTAEAFKAKTSDMLLEAWINALLSGPTTHAANMLSNSFVSAWSIPESATAAAISKLTGSGISGREALARGFGILEGAKDGIRAAWRAFKTEEPSDAATKLDVRRYRAIPSVDIGGVEIGGKQVRIPGRLLQAEDEFFKAIGYRQEIGALSMRKALSENLSGKPLAERVADLKANPTEEMVAAARNAAAKQTFTNPLGEAGQALTTMTRELPALRVVMPFVRTPLNVVKFAAERSPLAPLFREVRANLAGEHGAVARDHQIARIALGSSVSAAAAYMAAEGLITGGGPAEPQRRALMRADGWQPYSVKIGDTHYSFSRLDPMGMLMGVAADFAELSKAMKQDEKANIAALMMGSVSRNLVSKTWLQGPSDLIEAVQDPQRYGPRYIQRLIGTVVPTGVAQLAKVDDPYLREARNILDTIRSRIPGERDKLFIRRDAFGDPIVGEGAVGADLLSPIYQSTARNDAAIAELLRLKVYPGRLSRKLQGVELSDAEYDQYSQAAGNLMKQSLDTVVALPEWAKAPDDAKEDLMREVIRKTRDVARTTLIAQSPDLALRIAQAKQTNPKLKEVEE